MTLRNNPENLLCVDLDNTFSIDELRYEIKKITRQHKNIKVGIVTARTIELDFNTRETGKPYTDINKLLVEENIALDFISTTHCLYILDKTQPTIALALQHATLLPNDRNVDTTLLPDYLKYRLNTSNIATLSLQKTQIAIHDMVINEHALNEFYLSTPELQKYVIKIDKQLSFKPLQIRAITHHFYPNNDEISVLHIDDKAMQIEAVNLCAQRMGHTWEAIHFNPALFKISPPHFYAHLSKITAKIIQEFDLATNIRNECPAIPDDANEKYKIWHAKWHISESDYFKKLNLWPCVLSKNARKTIFLLADYVGVNFVDSIFTLFSRRHHMDELGELVNIFFSIPCFPQEKQQTFKAASVSFILKCLKETLGDKEIKPHGDLAAILNVIRDMTGVDFSLQHSPNNPTQTRLTHVCKNY